MAGTRICVRLSDSQNERLKQSCGDTDQNVTDIVRQALDAFLSPEAGLTPITASPARLFPPEQILTAVRKYFAWGSGDARLELKRQFTEILACSYALKKTFPRTVGIRELYESLRSLSQHFGMD
jgi:hypothetical protein